MRQLIWRMDYMGDNYIGNGYVREWYMRHISGARRRMNILPNAPAGWHVEYVVYSISDPYMWEWFMWRFTCVT